MSTKKTTNKSERSGELRREADRRLHAGTGDGYIPVDTSDTQRLLHELEVHQVELEMQNAELLQARDGLERALEKYTDLYDFAPVGYFSIGRDGVIQEANLTGASLLDSPRSSLIGRSFDKFIAVSECAVFTAFINKVFADTARRETCEVKLKSHGVESVYVQIKAVTDTEGQTCRAVVIDISERRRLGVQLAEHAADLTAANIELEAFNYTVSHDLRQPLTTINGYCQVLQEISGELFDEEAMGYLREIHEATDRMNHLIDTLLEFSKAVRITMTAEKLDLSKIVEEVAHGLEMTEPKRLVMFKIASNIEAYGDAGLLRVIINNLVGNAWKFTRCREEATIEFGMTMKNGLSAYFVQDNGSGFDMAHADKIFNPFTRIPEKNIEGHGIGLATVARIIKRHGGRIWPESVSGQGSTFFFTLQSELTLH